MKRSIPVMLLIISAIISCTRHSEVSDTLAHADAVMEQHPDSALALLEAIPDSTLVTDRDRALHALLLTQALDKNYIDVTSDSLINIAVNYFQNHGSKEYLALSYYYRGRIHSESGNSPFALEDFQCVLEILKEYPDKDLENRVYAQKAYIFHVCGMYKNALNENKKALDLCTELKDTIGIIETAHSLGFEYYSLNLLDSAMSYYCMALDLAKEINNSSYENSIIRRIVTLKIENKEIIEAEELYLSSQPEKALVPDRSSSHSIGAKIAIAKNDYDRLRQHLYWLVDSGNVYGKKFALRNLLQYFNNNYTPDSITLLAKELFALEDTIQSNNDTYEMAQIEYLYNYTQQSIENQNLRIEQEKMKTNIVVAGFLIVFLLIIIYWGWYRFNIRIKRQKIVFENLKEEYDKACKKIDNNINKTINGHIRLMSIPEINESICSALNNKTKTRLNWSKLEDAMNKYDSDFCKKIGGNYILSELEWKVTLLIRIGMSPQQIGQIINMSPSGITSLRKRLYKKVFGKEPSSPKDWDAVIHSL